MSFRAARIRAGLKVADVQRTMNVSDAAVYMWETRTTSPRASLLPKLAALYNCTVDELLEEDSTSAALPEIELGKECG